MRLDLRPGADIAALVRDAPQVESIVVVIDDGGDSVACARAIAAVAPLAVEAAPRRVSAVLASPGADPADIDAAVAFLESAASTTGQLIEVTSAPVADRTAPAPR